MSQRVARMRGPYERNCARAVTTGSATCGHSFDVAPDVAALTRAALAALEVVAKRDCGDAALTQTQALQERRCLGILRRLVLRLGVRYGRDLSPCILLLPELCSMMSLGPDLCSCILHGPDPSVLLHRPDLRWGILHHPYRSNLRGLYGLGLCPCIVFVRPGLELLEQGFSERPADLGLALIGRFRSRSNFLARRRVACRRRQILGGGDRLNCRLRRIGVRLKRRFSDPRSRDVLNERNRISHR
jgi:hypothetical protein